MSSKRLTNAQFKESCGKILEAKGIENDFVITKMDNYISVSNKTFADFMNKINTTKIEFDKDHVRTRAITNEVFDSYIEQYAKDNGYVPPVKPNKPSTSENYIFEFTLLYGGEGFAIRETTGKSVNDLTAGMTAEVYMEIPDEILGGGEDMTPMFEDSLGWSNVTIEGKIAKGTIESSVCNMSSGIDKWFEGEETDGVYEIEIHNGDVAFTMDGDYKMVIAINKGTANTGNWVMYMRQ